ncbi:MAG: heme o synthase [Chloroflexota bacterium]
MASELRTASAPTTQRVSTRQAVKTVVALFKLRVVSLLLLAAVGGAFLGAGGWPAIGALLTLLITGTLAAGGASAINQYLERESDTRMRRTQRRPLPSGHVEHPTAVLLIAVAMVLAAVVAVAPWKPAMALYLALGALIYVGVYTIWLKPRSVTNIVIGGAAGSCAVMTGGAAVGAASDPGVIALALLIFLWTPVHFWALAMFYKEDYERAGVPMLPARAPARDSAWFIFIHAVGTAVVVFALGAHSALGWVYLIPAGLMTVYMLVGSVKLLRNPTRKQAIRLFITSNLFLMVVLIAVMTAALIHRAIA